MTEPTVTCIVYEYQVHHYYHSQAQTEETINQKVSHLVRSAIQEFNCQITSTPRKTIETSPGYLLNYIIQIQGGFQNVINSKHFLQKHNPSQSIIKVDFLPCLDSNRLQRELQQLEEKSNTKITKLENSIEICGQQTESVRLKLLELLDELLGLSKIELSIPSSMHLILAGRKRQNILEIMFQTKTTFYIPLKKASKDSIIITGTQDGVEEAAKKVKERLQLLEKDLVSKKVPCLPRKIDWLLNNRKDELRKIMADNSVDISFPKVDKGPQNLVKFQGTKMNLIDRAIRAFKRLCCESYVASIQTANVFENQDQFLKYLSTLAPHLFEILNQSIVEILIHRNIIEIYGLDTETKKAYQMITTNEAIRIRDTKFQIELASEHKEFINGKKNGKINRIVKLSNCRISFQENNDFNMSIDLYSPVPSNLLQGVSMLEEELPAEMSFHIPESFHKRIIGVAGKNIQKIMKRFGVYVKFSNTEEFDLLGGYYENLDNVICRTPSKNKENLKYLKSTIIQTVNAPELVEDVVSFKCPPQFLWWLTTETEVLLVKERENHIRIDFEDCEIGNKVFLQGPQSMLEELKERLLDMIPVVVCCQLPHSTQIVSFFKSSVYLKLVAELEEENLKVTFSCSPIQILLFFICRKSEESKIEKAKANVYSQLEALKIPTAVEKYHFGPKIVKTSPPDEFGDIFSGSTPNIRHLFSQPPGLLRSGSDLRKTTTSIIGRERHPLGEKPEYRRVAQLGLTMPDLSVLGVKSTSMSDILLDEPFKDWATFGKSLSQSAIKQEFYQNRSPTDKEFDQKMEDQVSALDSNPKDFTRIEKCLKSIELDSLLEKFVEHEIDYEMFLCLEDGDLKELGVKALGNRKKILSLIKNMQVS